MLYLFQSSPREAEDFCGNPPLSTAQARGFNLVLVKPRISAEIFRPARCPEQGFNLVLVKPRISAVRSSSVAIHCKFQSSPREAEDFCGGAANPKYTQLLPPPIREPIAIHAIPLKIC